MTTRILNGTAVSPTWMLPLYLLRTAWADQPFDELTEWFSDLAEAHLLEVVGDDVGLDVDPGSGPVAILPDLLRMLRAGAGRPVPERLSLLTASAGDTSALPPVPGLREDVLEAGSGLLVRDPETGSAVCMTARATGGEVLRWRARGIGVCPVAPQPSSPARAGADLTEAVGSATTLIEQAARSPVAETVPPGPPRGIDIDSNPSRLPDGLGSRTLDLLDRADRVTAIVGAALQMPHTGSATADREPVLRRLTSAVDSARRAAVAAAGEEAPGR